MKAGCTGMWSCRNDETSRPALAKAMRTKTPRDNGFSGPVGDYRPAAPQTLKLKRLAEVSLVANGTVPLSRSVEAVNSDGDGGVDVTIFSGPSAEHRAREYARWKYGAQPNLST